MTQKFFIFYAEANIVCIIIIALLFIHDQLKVNRRETQIRFNAVLITHVLYFVSDAFWAAVVSGYLQRTAFSVSLLNISNCIIIALLAYAWLRYVAAVERLPWRNVPRGQWLARMPVILIVALIGIGCTVNPHFLVSADTGGNTAYYPMLFIAPAIYVVSAFWFSIREVRKIENISNRRLYLMLGLYPIIVILIGALQIMELTVPLFCFGTTIVLLYFYIGSLEDQISIDPLTKLNNRGQLNRYVAQSSNLHKAGLTTYVVMIDVNDFKEINDEYGHAEGDRALITVAETLKSSVGKLRYPPFIGRYGGDEFILVVHAESEEDVKALATSIRQHLERRARREELPFEIGVGIGCDPLVDEDDSFRECLKRADLDLYRDKALQKRMRRVSRPQEAV